MVIERRGNDEFHLNSCDMTLGWDALEERLRRTGHWSDEQLEQLKAMEVGDSTNPPYAVYYINGVGYASNNGVPDMKKPLT